MKNKGFTLIELLAVIVILAIIALIATPIILGIINNAREESKQRTAELVRDEVKLAYTSYLFDNTGAGVDKLCTDGTVKGIMDTKYFAMDGAEVTSCPAGSDSATVKTGQGEYTVKYSNGTVTITGGTDEITAFLSSGEISK